ncbi:MAG: DUF6798 domain-containing protein [Saprospiraceae bacterium]
MRLFIAFLLFYGLLITFHGYTFGDNDHIELMSYVNWINDNSLYPNDFYIQHIVSRIPNERIFTVKVLSVGYHFLEYWTFFLHLSATLGLLYGLFKIAGLFLQEEWKIWLFLLILFFPLYSFNLGGNDIYYNALSASNLSKSLGVWCIYFALQQQYYRSSVFAIAATLFHPIAGLQVFLLSFGAAFLVFIEKLISKKSLSEEKNYIYNFIAAISIYVAAAGIWLYLLFSHFDSGSITSYQFLKIIRFRLPHHFIPTAFGIKNYVFFLLLISAGLYYFFKKSKNVFYMLLISIAGMWVYTIAVGIFDDTRLIATQWFKTSIWVKPLSLIALLSMLFSRMSFKSRLTKYFDKAHILLSLLSINIALFLLTILPNNFISSKIHHLPFRHFSNAEIEIAFSASQLTPKNAVFLTPASCTAFKFYSKRSSYVDFKAVTHSKSDLVEWFQRIQDVYHLENSGKYGLDLTALADQNFSNLKEAELPDLKSKGITHLLAPIGVKVNCRIIAQNKDFLIYELP